MFRLKQFTTGAVVYWTKSSIIKNGVYETTIKRGRVVTCDRKQSCVKADDANELSWISNLDLFTSKSDLTDRYNLPWYYDD